jgi:hypothetical protein
MKYSDTLSFRRIDQLRDILMLFKVNLEDRFPGSIGREAPLFMSDVGEYREK